MADIRVRRMSTTALKTYMMLLHEAFVCETRPNLPDDEEKIELMAYCSDHEEWLSVRESVLSMFSRELVEGTPVLSRKRLQDDWTNLQAIRRGKSAGAADAAHRKWKSQESSKTRSERLAEARKKATHTTAEWESLLSICGNLCVRCGSEENIRKDHIVPIYQGGSDGIDNLQPLCQSCNSSKGPDTTDHRRPNWLERLRNVCGTSEMPAKEVSKGREEREEKEETIDLSSETDGQDVNLKPLKASMIVIATKYWKTVGGYDSSWGELKTLADAFGSGVVLGDFDRFLESRKDDEFSKGVLVPYLREAPYRLAEDSTGVESSAKDPEVVSLARELSYLSSGLVAFADKQRGRLAEVLKEFTAVEITAAFKSWISDQDLSDPKNVQYLAGKFVQIVDSLAYSARKHKQEAEQAKVGREAAVARLQEEAEIERQAREKMKEAEENVFDPLADLVV